jgi:hypothetical protein
VTPISAGAVLSRSLAVWVKNLAPFLLLTLLVTLPGHVLHFIVESGRLTSGDADLDLVLPTLVDTVLIYIASGAICFGVFQGLRGKPVSFFRCVLVGLRKLPKVVLAGLVAGLAIGIGWLVFVIPGLFLACVLYVVVPVAVLEGGGVATSIQRSAQLTAGSRLQLFAIGLISFLVNYSLAKLAVDGFEKGSPELWTARIVLAVVFASFSAVTSTVAYHDLRVLKEGHAPDDVADIYE